MSTPKLINFPHVLDSRSLRKKLSTPKLVNFPIFWIPGVEKYVCIYIYICIYACPFKPFWKKTLFLGATLHFHILPSILVYADGSKFQSVNTKTSQFSPFFDLHEFEKNMSTPKVWEKNMSTPKLVNFPHFLTCTSLRKTCQHQKLEKKHVNTKTSQFSTFFDLHEFEKNMSTPKLVNFHHFLDSRSLRKTCQHQN